jgi:hypothetical protein
MPKKWKINKINQNHVTFTNSKIDEHSCISKLEITSDILPSRKKIFCLQAWLSESIEDSLYATIRHEFELFGFKQHLDRAITSRNLDDDDYENIVLFLLIIKTYEPIAMLEFYSMLEVFSIWPSDIAELSCVEPQDPLSTMATDLKIPERSLPISAPSDVSKQAFFKIEEINQNQLDLPSACDNSY